MGHIFGEQYELGMDNLQLLYLCPDQKLPILLLVSEERQTAVLRGRALFGRVQAEVHDRGRGFQVVKDPKDKSKLALAINGQVIGEWFKEQFGRLFSSVKRTVEPLRRGKGMGL